MALTGEDAILLACFRFLFRGHVLLEFRICQEEEGLEAVEGTVGGSAVGAAAGAAGESVAGAVVGTAEGAAE